MKRSVDMTDAIEHLKEALTLAEEVAGIEVPRGSGRDRSAAQAEITRKLLFMSHVCDRARIATLDEYHATRGYE